MINESGLEINKEEHVFLRKKPCILGKEVLDFRHILFKEGRNWIKYRVDFLSLKTA